MDWKRRMEELRLRKEGFYKEHGAWKAGPKALEDMSYKRNKEVFMRKAAEERGRMRARKEADKWKNRPTFTERFEKGMSNMGKMAERGAKGFSKQGKSHVNRDLFDIPQSHGVFGGEFDYSRKKMKVRRPI